MPARIPHRHRMPARPEKAVSALSFVVPVAPAVLRDLPDATPARFGFPVAPYGTGVSAAVATRAPRAARPFITDGPFAESKELAR